jgi:hypothetical protein
MTVPRHTVQFSDVREAADLAAFLGRLIHYDRAAAVRLQASGTALGVFGRPPSFEVLAIRTARLAKPCGQGLDESLDVTVSAGDLLESIDERAATADVPRPVTGPPWAGVLPPRGGWRQAPGLPSRRALLALVAGVVAEFRARTEELGAVGRTRAALDRIGRDLWSRQVGDSGLPVRAAHAAYALGFLREPRQEGPTAAEVNGSGPAGTAGTHGSDTQTGVRGEPGTPVASGAAGHGHGAPGSSTRTAGSAVAGVTSAQTLRTPELGAPEEEASASAAAPAEAVPAAGAASGDPSVALFVSGAWLRLRTPYGSIAVRRSGTGTLPVLPV